MKRKHADDWDDSYWSHDVSHTTVRQLVLEELDIEIGLRSRLEETIQGRIAWAMQMQAALRTRSEDCADAENGFKSVALNALNVIESPCEVILPMDRHLPQINLAPAATPVEDLLPRTARPRSLAGRGRPATAAPKLLFIRYVDPDEPDGSHIIAKLACTDCSRTDFATLQGLVNHCRMGHNRSYGTHDDCISACAVPITEPEEKERTIEIGTEVASGGVANLPSLLRLFAMAVGEGGQHVSAARLPATQEPSTGEGDGLSPDVSLESSLPSQPIPEVEGSTYLSRSLGYHKDSPALAPFLGRAPKRRCINVYEEDADVDLGEERTSSSLPPLGWKMHYGSRSCVAEHIEDDVTEGLVPSSSTENEHEHETADSSLHRPSMGDVGETRSRFYVTTRIVVADRSLWISPERRLREHGDHTHQWMISISSPSYTRALSTCLLHATVTSLSAFVTFSPSTSDTTSAASFFVRGTTDQPFLAQITLFWADSSAEGSSALNAPTVIEHWVDIGPEKYDHAILGEEQLIDIELDRRTEFLESGGPTGVISWDEGAARPKHTQRAEGRANTLHEVPEYLKRLGALLPRYPMTLKEVTARRPPVVPYYLAPSGAHLQQMVYGRRKAIELSRARAFSEAYNKQRENDVDCDIPYMSAAQVFRWLEAEGLFSRPAPPLISRDIMNAADIRNIQNIELDHQAELRRFCAICGLDFREHPPMVTENLESAESAPRCPYDDAEPWQSLPVLDACKLLMPPREPLQGAYALAAPPFLPRATSPFPTGSTLLERTSAKDIIDAADPHLVMAVEDAWTALGFNVNSTSFPTRDLELGSMRGSERTDGRVAQAVLALALSPFVRQLVGAGVEELRRQLAASSAGTRAEGGGSLTSPILTPNHILRGLRSGAGESELRSVMFVALSDLQYSG